MTKAIKQRLTLEQFLKLPETKPASEYINGEIFPKSMPQGEHSRLQYKLCAAINEAVESQKVGCAFPELRCTFGGQSLIPDISVFRWERIPITSSGRIANRFEICPDWAIEILSPDQRQTKVLGNLLHCSQYGAELGWLIDPEEESILVVLPEQRVQLLRDKSQLPMIKDFNLVLTVEEIFSWLTL